MTKPTLKNVWEWYKKSQEHLESCNKENCDWYWEFVQFKKDNSLE